MMQSIAGLLTENSDNEYRLVASMSEQKDQNLKFSSFLCNIVNEEMKNIEVISTQFIIILLSRCLNRQCSRTY